MEIDRQESGALIVRAHRGVPFYEAKWRDAMRHQRKRRLGRAWLVPDSNGDWRKRRGRVRDGFLDERRAYREMAGVIAEVEAEQQIAPCKRDTRFEDAVGLWMEHLEFEKRAKPSTLDRHRNLLAKPRHDVDGQRGARIMREFEGRKLRSITAEDVRRFLARLDREDISARTQRDLRPSLQPGGRPQATRGRRPPGRDLRAGGDPRRGRRRQNGPSPETWRLHAFEVLRRDRSGVGANQRAGRGPLSRRRLHRPPARRAACAALVRR